LEWVIKQRGVAHVHHYLDDFNTLGELGANTCSKNLQLILDVSKEVGVTVALEKCAGPAVCIVFLGIELDSDKLEMRLDRLRDTIKHWRGCKGCFKLELLSLLLASYPMCARWSRWSGWAGSF
jgi:hypothetical protein